VRTLAFAALALSLAAPVAAQPPRPKLIVALSVDQLSADLFAEYRQHFTGGLKRLSDGVVFPSGYQSHAATETCPGHSTILTGARPARTGIIGNSWIDQSVARPAKHVYCAEDETRGASSKAGDYAPSAVHLLVPTLGERMKAADPNTRVVAVSGKDRGALMMGGGKADQIWFLRPTDYARFETLRERTGAAPAAVAQVNSQIDAALAAAAPAQPLTPLCQRRARPISIGGGQTVGDKAFARAAGDKRGFRNSPEADAATLDLATGLFEELRLGRGASTDLLAVSLSATDFVGHTYGTSGSEMCIQLTALDAQLGRFFERLDASGIDYVIALTADHGGLDLPERAITQGAPDAVRMDTSLAPDKLNAQLKRELKLSVDPLLIEGADVQVNRAVPAKRRAAVLRRAAELYRASPLVETVLLGTELGRMVSPSGPPETWSLAERARASYFPGRSGDLIVALKPRVTPIPDPTRGYVATHGSFWDYDRRVPILFWWKGVQPFEQPLGIETVDIMPTLASLIALPVPAAEIDGHCLDLDPGTASNCPIAAPQPRR
jgi:predicted AlkP superfamily pyrophosphatase or phosphodiesterase